ncbi:YtpI family protein [Corticicoccus populi]|uniref:YtpI family protein n=1 Tax=Corticicoccus populi TaxID=1812821 RepID=A0ABW5WT45_9STAP
MELLYLIIVSSLVSFLFLSLLMFVIYKMRQIRSVRDVQSVYFTSISRIWLGLFLVAMGLNSIIQFTTSVAIIVGAVFILFGAYNVYYFNKARKKFKANLPIEEKAWEEFEARRQKSR